MADAMFTRSQGTSVPQQAETQHIISRINAAHDLLSQIEGHVGAAAETLWGPAPPADKPSSVKPVVPGFLGQALESLESLTHRLAALEQRASRLRSL